DTPIMTRRVHRSQDNGVNLMTSHKSKGLEFDTVYIIDAVDSLWGQTARSRGRMISYPENLPLAPSGGKYDERLCLFYDAMTRARKSLIITYTKTQDNVKTSDRAGFLLPLEFDNHSV